MIESKKYMDFNDLSLYDSLLKEYINDGLADKIDKSSTGYQTITGNPLEFDSPSPQIVGIKCDIEPSQDLHGYDKPWAGGEGKNKFIGGDGATESGVTATKNADGSYSFSGTATGPAIFTIAQSYELPSGSYILSGGTPEIRLGFNYDDVRVEDTGSGVHFDLTGSGITWVQIVISEGTSTDDFTIYPMIRLSTETDPTFEPYSNICPISGVNEVSVTRCGKNYYDQSKAQINKGVGSDGSLISLSGDNGYASDYMNVKPLTTYKYIAIVSGGASAVGIAFYDSDKNVLSWSNINDVNANNYNITSPANAVYARCTMYIEDGHYGYFGLESIYTGLEPYQGETYTIDLDGTRYGGQLDVGSGVLTLTHSTVDLGTLTWSASYTGYIGGISGIKRYPTAQVSSLICDRYPTVSQDTITQPSTQFGIATLNWTDGVFIKDVTVADAEELTTKLNGAQLVYELATPQTVQLTPTQVWAVQGGNTITVSVDGVEAEIHSSNYATLQDINNIPTANDGTLTIQQNGVDVQTFTANQSSNATANISVPTKVSELDNDSGYTTNTGTVTGVKVGSSSTYNPTDGIVSIPAYPTTLPASDTTSTYNSSGTAPVNGIAVASALETLPEPMIFKGSLGTGGTITTLPAASSSNTGFTYKVITAGTYASQVAKVGDTFISDGTSWVLIPSGDEPSGTVTSVGITNGGGLSVSGSPVTSSGSITVSHADTSSQSSVAASTRTYINKVTLDTYGHVTELGTGTETVTDTTYTLSISGNNIILTPSSGTAQSISIPYAETSEVTKGVEINPTTTPTTPGSVWITT